MPTTKRLLHAHGCTHCRVRYTDACTDPDNDDRCYGCRGLKTLQCLIDSIAPRACCYANSRLATRAEKVSYGLAGRSNWHLCVTCSRTHPTRPRPAGGAT